MGSVKKKVLAAVGTLTVVAGGYWAHAYEPISGALLVAAGSTVLSSSFAANRIAERRLAAREAAHERALRRRDDRLAQTAHELRTPLTAILNSLEIVRLGYATTTEEIDGFLSEADLAAQHLSFLISDVLDEAAIKAGKLRLENGNHNVAELTRHGLRMLGMHAARNAITTSMDDDGDNLFVRADSRRVLQILFNLIGNSIKFSEPGQPIDLVVKGLADHVLFRVLDEGVGVTATVRPHLFSAYAGDDNNGRADSTGLGLQICKDLVEQMGGTIGYTPRATGSEFWFTLPIADERTRAPVLTVARA